MAGPLNFRFAPWMLGSSLPKIEAVFVEVKYNIVFLDFSLTQHSLMPVNYLLANLKLFEIVGVVHISFQEIPAHICPSRLRGTHPCQ